MLIKRLTDPLHGLFQYAARLLLLVTTALLSVNVVCAQNDDTVLFDAAWQLESAGNYTAAATAYRDYLLSNPPKSAQRRNARLKLPVLEEAQYLGISNELDLYLSALNSRAAGDPASALTLLNRITNEYTHSNYHDDALYLKAYIAMMDNYDFQLAHNTLQSLRYAYPDSRYYDTALYAEAIAQEQLGNRQLAINKLTELRDRHTSFSVGGLRLAADKFTSRLWFDRSDGHLRSLLEHQQQASTLVSMEPYGKDGYHWRAVVSANGQDFALLLNQSLVTKNTRIVSGDGLEIDSTDTNAFAGIVEGEADSWARITLAENNLRGMIAVYGERYRLTPTETGGTLSNINPLLLGDIDGNIMDEPDHALFPPKQQNDFDNYLRQIRVADGINFEEGTVSMTATIGVVVDSKFNSYYSGRGAQEAQAILNITDGIFREQFGLALHIDKIIVMDSEDDPMNIGRVTMEDMMINFSSYRQQSAELGSGISMATLFSANKNKDTALGLAWIGAVCRTDGYDVSVVSPFRMADLLSTHEIGHTLGAQHDNDTACSNDSSQVMWSHLSSSTRREFSSCSKASVRHIMANGTCFIETMDISADLIVSEKYVEASIHNLDSMRTTPAVSLQIKSTALAKLANPPANCSFSGADLLCQIDSLAAGSAENFELEFTEPLQEADTVTITANPIGFMDSAPDNNSLRGDIFGNITVLASTSINNNPGRPSGARPYQGNEAGTLGPLDTLLLFIILVGLYRRSAMGRLPR